MTDFTPDGQRLVGAFAIAPGKEGKGRLVVKAWAAATGQELSSLEGELLEVYSLAHTLILIGTEVHTNYTPNADPVVFSPDGRRIASTRSVRQSASDVVLWGLESEQEVLRLEMLATDPVLAFSADGHRLFGVGQVKIDKWFLPSLTIYPPNRFSFITAAEISGRMLQIWGATPRPSDRP